MRRSLGALALLVAMSSISLAEDSTSARGFEAGCRVIADSTQPEGLVQAAKAGKCVGAIQAIALLNGLLETRFRHCAPKEATLVQEAKAITKFIYDHPKRMNQDFVRVALLALYEAWPCG
jgi:hypothetical protein